MRPFAHLIPFFLLTVSFCQAFAGDAGEAKKLEGTWELIDLVVGGAKVAEKEVKGTKFVFKGTSLTILPPASDSGIVDKRSFSIVLDGKKMPAQVDLTALDGEVKGVTSPGIYKIEGDTLFWCQSDDPKSKDRPAQFASPDKSNVYLFTFKRAKQ